YGIDRKTLEAELTGATVRKNRFFDHLTGTPMASLLQAAPGQPLMNPFLLSCKTSDLKALQPQSELHVMRHVAEFQRGPIINIADPAVEFELAGEGISFFWTVDGPRGMHLEGLSNRIAFDAKVPGAYEMRMVAKNAYGVCAEGKFKFGVTWNEPFFGA